MPGSWRRRPWRSALGVRGHNDNDFVYVPSVQAELRRRGFDLLSVWDALESGEVRVAIALDPSIIRVVRVDRVEAS